MANYMHQYWRSVRQRYNPKINQFIDQLVASWLAPMLIAAFISALLKVSSQDYVGWGQYIKVLGQALIELSPIFLCKYLSLNARGLSKGAWWVLGFVLLPALGFIALNNGLISANFLVVGETALFILWALELGAIIRLWLGSKLKLLRFKPNLDNVFFILWIGVSLFMAAVFNSIDDPLENQPIHLVIDLKRNLLLFGSFISYFIQFLTLYGSLYFAYYLNHHVLINKVLQRHGVYNYLWVTTLFLIVFVPVFTQIIMWMPMNVPDYTVTASTNYNPFSLGNVHLGLLIIVLSFPLILAMKLQSDNRKLAELEQEKLATELKWLQQQINPHFLFNTLNNLYALCLSKSEKTPELILQLASLLRFVVYKGGNDRVSLNDEVSYLNDYLELQRLRVENKCEFSIDLPTSLPPLSISPLLLVVFVENAFKHGVELSDQQSTLNLSLKVEGTTLHFCCENSVPENDSERECGIGLNNVERRLALIYPDKHQLNISSTDEIYRVELTLDLT